MMPHRSVAALVTLVGAVGCYPTTTRPDITPRPDASRFEVEYDIAEATRMLAVELDADSIPIRRTEPQDGWLETGWFDSRTLQPTDARVGPEVVKLRAFVDPGPPNHSVITIEVVQRLLVDPALPSRELERLVSDGDPVMYRIKRAVGRLSPESEIAPAAGPPIKTGCPPDQPPTKACM